MIPLFKPACGDEEIEAVTRVMRSGWWGLGPEVEAFEDEFAEYTGARHAVAVSSGTMALELAGRALGVVDGVVIVPALTFVSSGLSMLHNGNSVIFADIEEDSLCISWKDTERILDALSGFGMRKAVLPVWYAGSITEVPPLPATVIEDCAHAAGTSRAGRQGDIACWSFQAVKNLATGDGGMITTNDENVAAELRRLRWCGIDRSTWDRDKNSKVGYGWDYNIPGDGEKAHMCDINAAIGRVQLRYLESRNAKRRVLAWAYNRAFRGLDWLRVPAVSVDSSQHLYAVRVPAERRDAFIQWVISKGVSAGVHYKPLTAYRQVFGDSTGLQHTPVTDRVWRELVTLPLFPDLTTPQFEQVVDAVRSFPA